MSRALAIAGAIPAAIAIGVVAVKLHGGGELPKESAFAHDVPRQSSRPRNGSLPTAFPGNAGQQSQRSLRAWAAAMDDAGLARAAARLADRLAPDGGDDPSTKALICAVLKEWGSRDVDAALAFVGAFDSEWQGRSGDPHLQHGSPAPCLKLAILVGHSETDAGNAWTRLADENKIRTNADFITPLGHFIFSDAEKATAAGLIFRNFLIQSPEGALDALRAAKREGRTDFTWNEGLLTCLAGIEDPGERLSLFNEMVPMDAALATPPAITRNSIDAILNNPNRRFGYSPQESAAKALAGLATRDPAQAWQVLEGADGDPGQRSDLADSFIRICASRQQEKALRFIGERLRDSEFVKPSVNLALCLLPHNPELAIEVISRRPREILPDVRWEELLEAFEVSESPVTPWPVADDIAAPPGPEEFRTRAIRAVENASLDEETRDALLKRLR
jgi:hypothetical protein